MRSPPAVRRGPTLMRSTSSVLAIFFTSSPLGGQRNLPTRLCSSDYESPAATWTARDHSARTAESPPRRPVAVWRAPRRPSPNGPRLRTPDIRVAALVESSDRACQTVVTSVAGETALSPGPPRLIRCARPISRIRRVHFESVHARPLSRRATLPRPSQLLHAGPAALKHVVGRMGFEARFVVREIQGAQQHATSGSGRGGCRGRPGSGQGRAGCRRR